jgi:hypothetical protein
VAPRAGLGIDVGDLELPAAGDADAPPRTTLRLGTGKQRPAGPAPRLQNFCLVQLKIARDAPRLLEFAIWVWTIPAPVVQIHIAIPATGASGRVARLQHSANSLKRGRTGGTVGTHAVTQ